MCVKRCYAGLLHDTPIAVFGPKTPAAPTVDISHFHLFVDSTGPQPNETPSALTTIATCHILWYRNFPRGDVEKSEKSFVFGPTNGAIYNRTKR